MLQESNEKIYFKIFAVSSHLHVLCKHYKTWSFQYNRDNACRWNVFSSSVTNSGTSCSPSSYLSGGIEPHSLSSSNTNLASVSRLSQWSNYIFTSTGRDIESTISTGKEYCESTGKYSNGRKILWMGSQTHQNLLSSSRVITEQFIVHDLDKYLDKQLTT